MNSVLRGCSGAVLPGVTVPDALQEFRVATSGLSADNGVHSGGSVNAVTKSGTNTFHGALFEFLRDKPRWPHRDRRRANAEMGGLGIGDWRPLG
jgi:hypothetical protein